MTPLFIDASALTAIIVDEPEAHSLTEALAGRPSRLTSAIALWETSVAVARIKRVSLDEAWREVERYISTLGVAVHAIDRADAIGALAAHERYGEGGGHPARLNMGDCFAYACAKTSAATLLYKGNDFGHTDLA